MKDFFISLLNNETVVWCAMALIVFLLTNLIKIPIKHLTSKIKDERKRRMANIVILVIPFAVGVVLDFCYTTYFLHSAFSILNGLGYGTAGISLYGVVERFFKVKIENPYDTEEGQIVLDKVEEIKEESQTETETESETEPKQESAIEKFKRSMEEQQ